MEVIGVISGLPKDPSTQIARFINKGKSSNNYINNLLESHAFLKSKSLSELEKDYNNYQKDLNQAILRLRDLKFRLIIRKTLRFSDKYKPRVEKTKVELFGTVISWKVKKNNVII